MIATSSSCPTSRPDVTALLPLLVDVAEVSRLTSLSPRTVWRYASCGKFPQPLKLGGRRLWRREEIIDWIESGCPEIRI